MSYITRQNRNGSSVTQERKKAGSKGQKKFRSQSAGKMANIGTSFGIGIAIALVLGLAVLISIGLGSNVASATGSGQNSSVNSAYGSLNHPKGPCGNAGQTSCAPADPGWFSVTSESQSDVIAAITGSRNFVAIRGRFGFVTTDIPVLVHAYHPNNARTGLDYYDDDHWVVSVRDASGLRNGIFDFVYDRTHQRMRFSSYGVLTSQDARSSSAFPYTSLSRAMASLQSQHRLTALAGVSPELIFFPIDPSFGDPSSPVHEWAGGGNSAMNPMWHIIGSDGHDYFVGADLNVHIQSEMPIAQGQP